MAPTGQLFYNPTAQPLSSVGAVIPGAYYNFYLSGTTTPATVYQDAALSLPYPTASLNGSETIYSIIQASAAGVFPPIFLDPDVIYRVQLYNSNWQLIGDVDEYVPAMPTTGNGPLALDAQGELVINAPIPGGTGVTLSLAARTGGTALALVGAGAGSSALAANSATTTGAQTATFSATNKPGSGTTAPTKWLPITCDGTQYYLPLWQ
jgi:hypothetical protein